eukprot:gene7927-7999_t
MKTIEKGLYHQPELDALLESRLSEIESLGKIRAVSYAGKNLPPLNNEKIHSYFHEDHHEYQALIDMVGSKLQSNTVIAELAEEERAMRDALQRLNNQKTVAMEQEITIGKKLDARKPPVTKRRLLIACGAICSVSLFSGIMAEPVFESWGYSLLHASLMCLMFAAVLAVFSHVFERIVLLGMTPWQQRLIAAGLLLFLIALFALMATARAENLSRQVAQSTSDSSIHFSPLPFILVELLLFIVAVALNRFLFPTRVQRAALREYQDQHKEKADNEAEQRRMLQEIEAIKQRNLDLRKVNMSIIDYGSRLEEHILSRASSGFAAWKKHNTLHRTDNGRPRSFDDETYPFEFKTNFKNVKFQ